METAGPRLCELCPFFSLDRSAFHPLSSADPIHSQVIKKNELLTRKIRCPHGLGDSKELGLGKWGTASSDWKEECRRREVGGDNFIGHRQVLNCSLISRAVVLNLPAAAPL